MPPTIAAFPYFELQFDKSGAPAATNDIPGIVTGLGNKVTDLFVISHGWNNTADEARSFYSGLFKEIDKMLPNSPMKGRSIGVIGIVWPSKKFEDKELMSSGGALSLTKAADPLAAKINGLKGSFSAHDADAKLEKAKALVPRLETSGVARLQFAELLLDIMRGAALEHPSVPQNEDNAAKMLATHGDELLSTLSTLPPQSGPHVAGHTSGGALGGAPGLAHGTATTAGTGKATGLGDLFHGIVDGARNALNFTTYYEMKNRAGIVGRGGVYTSLHQIRAALPTLRINLVGHSFGCRVVTAATDGPPNSLPVMPHSLILLQAAFSHYALASHWDGVHDGLFRPVLAAKKVQGPIALTCTKNDTAVGIAYAIASRLANQVASAIGNADDKYGGMGRNGAQKTPEADSSQALGKAGIAYHFNAGAVHNLNADGIIKGHSDVQGPEVAYMILCAAA